MSEEKQIDPAVIEAAMRVMRVAMEVTNERIADVFVDYSGHVASLSVRAHPAGVDFQSRPILRLLDRYIYLDHHSSHAELVDLYDDIAALRQTATV